MKEKGQKTKITLKDSVYSIIHHEVLMKAHVYVFNEAVLKKHPLVTRLIKIKNIAKWLNSQDKTSITNGLNYLIQNLENYEEIFYQIYEEDEIQVESSKRNTGFWYFPVKYKKTPFVLICPGGAYMECVCFWEGYPIAQKINELGYSAFVLKYRVGEDAANFAPMDDLAKTIRHILDNAEKFNIDPTNYAVMGFSAGGHLAASFGTEQLGFRKYNLPSPSALLLSYPAISMYHLTHKKMKQILMGKCPSKEVMDIYSIERNVDSQYPATFIWQCEADKVVQSEHSNLLSKSLDLVDVRHILLLFPGGKHGLGLAVGTNAEKWLKDAIKFWKHEE